jgi:uncharacterized protein YjiS (DUF1127 family)
VLQFNVSSQSSMLSVAAYKVVMFFERRAAATSRWKQQRETFKSLHKLTDRELNDIGISRGDIRSIASDTWEENNRRDNIRMNPNMRGFV